MSNVDASDCTGCSSPDCIYRHGLERRGVTHLPPRAVFILGAWALYVVVHTLFGVASAQTLGPAVEHVEFLPDLWSKIQQGGVIGAMFAIYFMWRAERRVDKF